MFIQAIKNGFIIVIIFVLLAVSIGLEGPLFGYRHGAPYLGLVWGLDYTNYHPILWPFLSQTNDIKTAKENLFADIGNYPWKALADFGIWLGISVVIAITPTVYRFLQKRLKKKSELGV
jgi:hypothetical protein